MTRKYHSRAAAERMVRNLVDLVETAAFAGSGHPDLVAARQKRAEVARERIILRLMGENDAASLLRLPPLPDVDYDR